MKTLTYVAAIALLTAGTAFAQTNTNTSTNANNGSTINNTTPTPAARGTAEGVPNGADQTGAMNHSMTRSGTSDRAGMSSGGSSMDQSSNMDHMRGKSSTHAVNTHARAGRHVAMRDRNRGNDAKENQETMELNRQQLANAGRSGASNYGERGYNQTAQSPNERGNPPMPTQRNPAINSVPQQRTYGASPR